MPVGGAETLLVNLVRRLDRTRSAPEVICLKEARPLGEELSTELPVYSDLLAGKFDLRVLPRLWRLMKNPQADAVITVGAGDKMFWGRVAARLAGVPVVASALHSTGWPDGVGKLNRLLTPWTDAFIGVADAHARHLVENEGFPAEKVHAIYNGVDCDRFAPRDAAPIRADLAIPAEAPVVGILAALRPEKNHELFLAGAQKIRAALPQAQFLVIGDGPRRADLEALAATLGIAPAVRFLGSRPDVPELLAACDLVALTSHNEASPVSILEALSAGCPVVATNVGSVHETVVDGETGRLIPAGDLDAFAAASIELLSDAPSRRRMGAAGRERIRHRWSLDSMVAGYEQLIERIHRAKTAAAANGTCVADLARRPARRAFR
jgi:glycosyltransferase involved in cell wall biosynthesis